MGVGGKGAGWETRQKACEFLLTVDGPPPSCPVRHQHQHRRTNHLQRAAHNARHFPRLSQEKRKKKKSDEEGPRYCKSSKG